MRVGKSLDEWSSSRMARKTSIPFPPFWTNTDRDLALNTMFWTHLPVSVVPGRVWQVPHFPRHCSYSSGTSFYSRNISACHYFSCSRLHSCFSHSQLRTLWWAGCYSIFACFPYSGMSGARCFAGWHTCLKAVRTW